MDLEVGYIKIRMYKTGETVYIGKEIHEVLTAETKGHKVNPDLPFKIVSAGVMYGKIRFKTFGFMENGEKYEYLNEIESPYLVAYNSSAGLIKIVVREDIDLRLLPEQREYKDLGGNVTLGELWNLLSGEKEELREITVQTYSIGSIKMKSSEKFMVCSRFYIGENGKPCINLIDSCTPLRMWKAGSYYLGEEKI